jgi:ribosome-binding protein aMBF1 (putative translation factor)
VRGQQHRAREADRSSSMNVQETELLRNLGFHIRERRTERKLTQAELADRCGLHRTFIGSVERGERNLSVLNLRIIARALRVPLTALFADADQQQSNKQKDE